MALFEVYYEIYYETYINPKLIFNQELNEYECDQEWEILTDKCYFRKNIAYYYTMHHGEKNYYTRASSI